MWKSLEIGVDDWESLVRNGDKPGVLLDIIVLLPYENSGWEDSIARNTQQEYVETSGLRSDITKMTDIDRESFEAFDVLSHNSVCIMPLSKFEHYDNQIRQTIKY